MLFVEIHKWYGVFLYKCTNITKSRNFFKKVVTKTRRATLTKQKLLLGAKNWRCINEAVNERKDCSLWFYRCRCSAYNSMLNEI